MESRSLKERKHKFIEFYWQRFKEREPSLKKTDIIMQGGDRGWSFEDAIQKSSKPDLHQVYVLEYYLDEFTLPRLFNKNNNLSIYDAIPKFFEKRHPKEYTTLSHKIHIPKKNSDEIERMDRSNLISGPARAEAIVESRERIYNEIKKQNTNTSWKNLFSFKTPPLIIDLQNHADASYNSLEGILSYCKSTNQINYSLGELSDKNFALALNNNFFDTKDNLNIVGIYSGQSIIELNWAKQIIEKNKKEENSLFQTTTTIIDVSKPGLFIGSLLNPTPFSSAEKIVNLKQTLDSYFDNKRENFFLINNYVCSDDSNNIFDQLEQIISTGGHIFVTMPTTSNSTDETYYGNPEPFGEYFLKDILLVPEVDRDKFSQYCDVHKTGNGSITYSIGLELNENYVLRDQTLTKKTILKKGTKILRHTSMRYSPQAITTIANNYNLEIIGDYKSGMISLVDKNPKNVHKPSELLEYQSLLQ